VNTLGIPQAHPALVKRKRPISYMLHMVELKSLFFFLEKRSTCFLGFSRRNRNNTCLTTTELPAPVAPFYFPATHSHTRISLFLDVVETLIVIPHHTRPYRWTGTIRIGLNSAQRGTLYPLVRLCDLMANEIRIRISFLPRTS
jgi:hypothetical protein